MTNALEGYTLPATPGEIGTAIKWDVGAAAEFAFQLLEDVNHHKLAKLVLAAMKWSDEDFEEVFTFALIARLSRLQPLCDCDDQNCPYKHDHD
jgi:hypothetical protein